MPDPVLQNGTAPESAPEGRSVDDVTAELRVAIHTISGKATMADDPEAAQRFGQSALFLADAHDRLAPAMKPVDPNIHVPPHVDPNEVMKLAHSSAEAAHKTAFDAAAKMYEKTHDAAHQPAAQAQHPPSSQP